MVSEIMTPRENAEWRRLNTGKLGRLREQSRIQVPLKQLAERAAAVAAQGYPVFPCKFVGSGKKPCTPRGFYDATDHPDKAFELFMCHPTAALIGVRCGVASMLVVVDVDPEGRKWLQLHLRRLGNTRIHMTPRGGVHIVYQMPLPPTPMITCRQVCDGQRLLGKGVDIKGDGGYVIWPGSPGYMISHDVPPAKMPAWLIRKLLRKPAKPPEVPRETRPPMNRFERLLQVIENAKTGERNQRIFWTACRAGELVKQGFLTETEAINRVAAAGERALTGEKDAAKEARATAISGVKTGMRGA